MQLTWDEFLEKIADVHGLDQEEREAFLAMFAEKGKIKIERQLSAKLNITESAVKARKRKVYDKFPQNCPGSKAKALQVWLNQQYSAQSKIQSIEATSASVIAPPDWHTICRAMLETQKQNLRRKVTVMGFELNVHVPLGLVERKHQPRRSSDFSLSPEQGSGFFQPTREEIIETYEHNEFLEQVIKQRQSKKSQGKRIAIIGEPGAGKTTLLEAIAFSRETPGFPIWISLGSLGDKSLEEYLRQKWLKDTLWFISPEAIDVTPELEKELAKLFNSGEVLLLLDGVDEMPAPSPVQALAKIREELTGWVADARVVLTCRVNVWDASVNALQGFDTYRTLDFSYGDGNKCDQVRQFICQWFSKAEKPELGEPLREKLDEYRHQRIRDLVRNPLRLSLLCQSWYFRQGDLPKTKAALYEQFTRAFYDWKEDRFSTTPTKRKELNAALGLLAREAIDKEKSRFGIRESFALDVMGEDLFNLGCKLHWLVHIYNDAETGKPVYAFFHPTFQEYFAACAIDDWHFFLNHILHNPNSGTYRIFEQQWKEVILLWLGREDLPKQEKQEFIKALVEFEDGCWYFYRNRAYLLAAAGIAEFRDCSLRELRDEIVGLLVDWSFCTHCIFKTNILVEEKPIDAYGYFPARETSENVLKWIENNWQKSIPSIEAAREVLKQTDREIAAALLVELLESQKDVCAEDVAFLLGQIDPGNQTAIACLADLTQPDIELNIFEEQRVSAASKLAKIDPGNEAAITALVHVIQTAFSEDFSEENTLEAAKSLARIDPGNKTATTFLVKWIETEGIDEYDLWVAADSLGRIDAGNETAIATLVQLVNVAKHKYLRHLGARLNLSEETSLTSLSELKRLMEHCHLLAESLGEINSDNETAITILEELLNPNLDKYILDTRCYVAESLGKIKPGNKTAITTLVELMQNAKDEGTRSEAVRILGEIGIGNEKAIAALIELIQNGEDEDEIVANSLNSIMQGDQFPKVVTALKHYMTDLVYENNFSFYSACHDVLWRCAQNMTYSEFYDTWHNRSINVQALEKQLTDIPSQIQPTDKIYPITLDTQSLKLETNTSAIAQKFSTKIYRKAGYSDIPTVSDAAQLQQQIPRIQEQLQKPNLALILHGCEPNEHLINFCYSFADPDIGIYIGLITSKPIEQPLKGFLPNQDNLLSAIQSWINEIG